MKLIDIKKKSRYILWMQSIPSTIEAPVSRPEELGFREETKSQISDLSPNGLLCNTNIQVIKTPRGIKDSALHAIIAPQYSEEKVNARIKEATDNL
ncbi:2256_t:CDS:1, partial [Gigaspora rosea]